MSQNDLSISSEKSNDSSSSSNKKEQSVENQQKIQNFLVHITIITEITKHCDESGSKCICQNNISRTKENENKNQTISVNHSKRTLPTRDDIDNFLNIEDISEFIESKRKRIPEYMENKTETITLLSNFYEKFAGCGAELCNKKCISTEESSSFLCFLVCAKGASSPYTALGCFAPSKIASQFYEAPSRFLRQSR